MLIPELLLFGWVMLLCLLMRAHLTVWDGSLLLSIRSITACSCPSRCSISTWATLFLYKLRWIRILNHALISLVHTDICRENAVIKVLLLSCVQRVWYLIFWCNSWCWFTTLRLWYILTCQFMEFICFFFTSWLWIILSSLWLSKMLLFRLNWFHPCATWSWVWLSVTLF